MWTPKGACLWAWRWARGKMIGGVSMHCALRPLWTLSSWTPARVRFLGSLGRNAPCSMHRASHRHAMCDTEMIRMWQAAFQAVCPMPKALLELEACQ